MGTREILKAAECNVLFGYLETEKEAARGAWQTPRSSNGDPQVRDPREQNAGAGGGADRIPLVPSAILSPTKRIHPTCEPGKSTTPERRVVLGGRQRRRGCEIV